MKLTRADINALTRIAAWTERGFAKPVITRERMTILRRKDCVFDYGDGELGITDACVSTLRSHIEDAIWGPDAVEFRAGMRDDLIAWVKNNS